MFLSAEKMVKETPRKQRKRRHSKPYGPVLCVGVRNPHTVTVVLYCFGVLVAVALYFEGFLNNLPHFPTPQFGITTK